jgi:hypothetical protein
MNAKWIGLGMAKRTAAESIEAKPRVQPISDQTEPNREMAICRVFAPFMQIGPVSIVDL